MFTLTIAEAEQRLELEYEKPLQLWNSQWLEYKHDNQKVTHHIGEIRKKNAEQALSVFLLCTSL